MHLVHQQKISDQQRVLHGAGRDLEGLHNEGSNKDGKDHHGKKSLCFKKNATAMLWMAVSLLRRSGCFFLGLDLCLCWACLCSVRLGSFGVSGWCLVLFTHAGSACARKCSSACLAASCSAFFFVPPSARATYSGLLCPCIKIRASTVKVFLWSGPSSFTVAYTGCCRPLDCNNSCSADL